MNSALFFSAEGRIPRSQYWLGTILLLFAQIGIGFMLGEAGESSAKDVLTIITSIGFIAVGFLLAIKRFHDLGKSGWFSLLLIIPLVGILIGLIWLGCFKGNEGTNKFGPDPLQKEVR